MAGEQVKDAKQATGIRGTSQTYTDVKLSFFKKTEHTRVIKDPWKDNYCKIVTATYTGVTELTSCAQYYRKHS